MAKILLADDSGHAQRMGAKILSAEGHEVATVSNGQAALKMLPGFAPDLIVADVFMPGKTGYEVCQFIKSDPKLSGIPVVLIVAPMEPYDSVEGERVHADGVVTKPLESSDLVATIQKLLAAVKKPAPPPSQPAVPEPEPQPEASAVDDLAIPITTPVALEIPEEMRQQPVSLIGNLLEPQSAPPAVAAVEGLTTEQAGPREAAPAEETDTALLEPLIPVPEAEAAGIEEPLAAVAGAPEPEPSTDSERLTPTTPVQEIPPAMTWAAEPVAVTEEDKKLFEPPPPDWQGLVSMVQEEGKHGQFPAVLAGGIGGAGSQAEAEPATELSAASVMPVETESPSAQTLLRPEGTADVEPAGEMVASSPATAKAGSPLDSVDLSASAIAPLDYATIQQIVRETVEELMPQIMDRIAQVTGISFEKKG